MPISYHKSGAQYSCILGKGVGFSCCSILSRTAEQDAIYLHSSILFSLEYDIISL